VSDQGFSDLDEVHFPIERVLVRMVGSGAIDQATAGQIMEEWGRSTEMTLLHLEAIAEQHGLVLGELVPDGGE
jgi:hypothetical protein